VRQKSAVLLDVSDSPAQRYGGLRANIFVTDSYLSTLWLDEPIEAAKKRRLARPALTDERNGAPGRNVNAHVIERDYGPEAMRDIPGGEGFRHALRVIPLALGRYY
jgi:hypothetical protein